MNPTHHQSPISTTMIVFVCSNCGTTCQQQPSSSSSYMINTTSTTTTSPQQQRQQQFVEKRTLLCMKCEEMNIQFEQWKISSLSSSSGNSTPQSPLTPTTTRGVAVATSSPLSSPTLFHSPATSQFLFMQTQVASSTTNSSSSGTLSSSPQQQRRIKKKPSVADQHCNPYAEAFVPQYHYSDNEDDENINNNNNKYDNGSSDVTDNETGAMMMEEEDEGFEYGDELNFLINRFGLQDQNKTRFMPYIN